tara:strand:+ start:478 stop:1473 length:996 start_codon:yes stop_codon:yes gene_type:complete
MKFEKEKIFGRMGVLISFLIILILIEFALRITGSNPRQFLNVAKNEVVTNTPDKRLGWIPKKGVHKFKPWSASGKDTILTVNGDNSRYTGEINDEKEKIIFIGGSITQGWAVNDNESFPFIIQAKYPYYKVYNYGVGGYGGYQSLLRLEKVIKKKKDIKFVVYGFIKHHEERNIATGKWMYILNYFSKRGHVRVPYASLDKNNQLLENEPIKYIKLPFSDHSALAAKIEQKTMYLKSFFRERKQTDVSLKIIEKMKLLSEKSGSEFVFLSLESFGDERDKKYENFFDRSKIKNIKCLLPQGKKYIVVGDGHPNELSHKIIAKCISAKLDFK